MLALERHRKILELLQSRGSLRTVDLAKMLRVTDETMRRDFEKLEADGLLQRSHGGVVRIEATRRDIPSGERETQNAAAKAKIARAALARVKPGQTIVMDASTTVLHLARLLPDEPLTVLTNSLQTATVLAAKPSIHVLVLGGRLQPRSLSCAGRQAEEMLSSFRIDSAYLSCRGIHPVRGLSESSEDEAALKRTVVRCAEEVCLLADASKWDLVSGYFFAQPADIDLWITDRMPPLARRLRKDLPVEVAKEFKRG